MATIEDLRRAAHRKLPSFVAEYLEGGAENEITLHRNRDVFSKHTLVPRMLTDVASIDTSTTLFGKPIPFPVVVAPTGLNGLLTHEGDLHLASAASSCGVTFSQSMVSMQMIEDVSKRLAATLNTPSATPARTPHWMQLYVLRDRAFTLHILDRARNAKCEALVVTVDGPVYGNREWDKRNYIEPTILNWSSKRDVLMHLRWLCDVWRSGHGPRFVNVEHYTGAKMSHAETAKWLHREMDASLNWQDIVWLRQHWAGKLIVKGLMSVEDVARAIDVGADAVVLSNHGGRQQDLVASPMTVLPAAADFAAGRVAILLDSGIRRGSDIVQAVAMGADAVMVGRAVLYGLAAGREGGARRALHILKEEFSRTMALLGRRSVSELDRTLFA
jgi:(S)-mandelate dehydrogenase